VMAFIADRPALAAAGPAITAYRARHGAP
jgi:hypothetical protein